MPSEVNVPVLIGAVPLFYVQKMTIDEGYNVVRLSRSQFYQALSPTLKEITIEAVLIGPERMALKKSLEILALTSRLLVSGIGPFLKFAGVAVVSGLTISPNMMVTSLSFTQSVDRREALDVTIKLQEVPMSSKAAMLGGALDLALTVGSAFIASSPPPGSLPRQPVSPFQ